MIPITASAASAASVGRAGVQARPRSLSGDLAAALKAWSDSRPTIRSSEPDAIDLELDSVTCVVTGSQTVGCRATYSNGMTEQFEMAVLADGHTWIGT